MQKIFSTHAVKHLSYISATVISLVLASPSSANSSRILWSNNGHYYQRIDSSGTSWPAAKYICEDAGGHLATITSESEQGFISANFDLGSNGYFIGGTKEFGVWKWITGEKWSYENWERFSLGSGSYLGLNGASYWSTYGNSGFICEWSNKNVISSVVIPDINKNGTPEFATLYRGAKTNAHVVNIKDGATKKVLGSLSFPPGTGPSLGMVTIKNIEASNTTPELAVLIYSGSSLVQIKDVKHNLTIVNNIIFLDSDYKPKSITVSPGVIKSAGNLMQLLRWRNYPNSFPNHH